MKLGHIELETADPPASMRYTECKMTHAALEMLDDLDKDTVDFQPNYDESRREPTVLPGRYEFSCRMLDPVSGAHLSLDRGSFDVN